MSKESKLRALAARHERHARTAMINDEIKAARKAGTPAAVTAARLNISINRVRRIAGAYQ